MHPPTQPIFRYPDVWEFYKKAMASFWTVDEVDLGQDMRDWLTLRSE
jgi:ribonucleotide reductase beta subunit family protein with ferritin-like domain